MFGPSKKIDFEWDQGNRDKNKIKHGVSIKECEEIFHNTPLVILDDAKHSSIEVRYRALGTTHERRYLAVAFTERKDKIRVISARDQNRKERAFYETYKKN